jgi:hypothetical protein
MLVKFSSIKTESITMFGDSAVALIRMMGATGAVPGALNADDIPAAIKSLRERLQAAPEMEVAVDDESQDREREPPINLATRAIPLLDLLQRAAAAKVPVMWEKA